MGTVKGQIPERKCTFAGHGNDDFPLKSFLDGKKPKTLFQEEGIIRLGSLLNTRLMIS